MWASDATAFRIEVRSSAGRTTSTDSPQPIFACVLAVRGDRLEELLDEVGPVLGGSVEVAEYALSGTAALGEHAVAGLGERYGVILARHGTVTVGRDLEEAFYRLEVLERAAHVQVLR